MEVVRDAGEWTFVPHALVVGAEARACTERKTGSLIPWLCCRCLPDEATRNPRRTQVEQVARSIVQGAWSWKQRAAGVEAECAHEFRRVPGASQVLTSSWGAYCNRGFGMGSTPLHWRANRSG